MDTFIIISFLINSRPLLYTAEVIKVVVGVDKEQLSSSMWQSYKHIAAVTVNAYYHNCSQPHKVWKGNIYVFYKNSVICWRF